MRSPKIWAVVVLVGVLVAAACGGSSSTTNQGNKTLTVDTAFQIQGGLDPARTSGVTATLLIAQMYQTLLTVDKNDTTKVAPSLAESFTSSPDGKSMTFKLRHDVRFSDGTSMTSADVVFSLTRIVNIKGDNSSYITGMTFAAPDNYTVVVSSDSPNLAMASSLAFPQIVVLNSKVLMAHGGSDAADADKSDTAEPFLNQQSVGSGPYVLDTIDPQSQVVLKANSNFWGPKPAYTTVVFRNEAPQVQLLDVQKGSNTVALDLSPQQGATLPTSTVAVLGVPALQTISLELNANPAISPASAVPAFRQAVRYAIDYSALLGIAGLGARQDPGMLAPGIPGALPATTPLITRDLTKAKALLAQSGVQNPTIAMDYPSDQSPEGLSYAVVAQSIQASLKDVGITVNLLPAPSAAFTDKWKGGKSQMLLRELGGAVYDPSVALLWCPGCLLGGWMGWSKGMDPNLENIVAQIKSATSTSQRDQLYLQDQAILNDDAVFLPLFSGGLVLAASKSVGGLNLNSVGNIRFWEMT